MPASMNKSDYGILHLVCGFYSNQILLFNESKLHWLWYLKPTYYPLRYKVKENHLQQLRDIKIMKLSEAENIRIGYIKNVYVNF